MFKLNFISFSPSIFKEFCFISYFEYSFKLNIIEELWIYKGKQYIIKFLFVIELKVIIMLNIPLF